MTDAPSSARLRASLAANGLTPTGRSAEIPDGPESRRLIDQCAARNTEMHRQMTELARRHAAEIDALLERQRAEMDARAAPLQAAVEDAFRALMAITDAAGQGPRGWCIDTEAMEVFEVSGPGTAPDGPPASGSVH